MLTFRFCLTIGRRYIVLVRIQWWPLYLLCRGVCASEQAWFMVYFILTRYVKQWSTSFDCLAAWKAHDGIVLSSVVTKHSDRFFCLVTGGSDSNIKVDKIVLISSQLFMRLICRSGSWSRQKGHELQRASLSALAAHHPRKIQYLVCQALFLITKLRAFHYQKHYCMHSVNLSQSQALVHNLYTKKTAAKPLSGWKSALHS